jgi:membrane protease subunit (stomatin/prohibitin family)
MTLSVEDSRKLLVKLVGTENLLDRQSLVTYFRAVLMTKVKTYIAQTMRQNAINIFEIDEQLELFSSELHSKLTYDFLEYGINLNRFYVTTIVKPDGNPQYERFKELHFRQYADIAEAKLQQQTDLIHAQTEAQKVVIDSQAQATKRAQEGYTYQQERGFDVAQDAAKNEGAGQFTNMGIGLGMMAGVGGGIANMVGGAVNTAFSGVNTQLAGVPDGPTAFCDNCGAKLTPGTVFCEECGTKVAVPDNVCRNCGYQFERPGKFCPKCGTRREG